MPPPPPRPGRAPSCVFKKGLTCHSVPMIACWLGDDGPCSTRASPPHTLLKVPVSAAIQLLLCQEPLSDGSDAPVVLSREPPSDTSPVELVDVFDVAKQGADLIWLEWQLLAIDDAAQVVLQGRKGSATQGASHTAST